MAIVQILETVSDEEGCGHIKALVGTDEYALYFDGGGTLAAVEVNGDGDADYDEDLVEEIIEASFQ